jgi:hypothetical protein
LERNGRPGLPPQAGGAGCGSSVVTCPTECRRLRVSRWEGRIDRPCSCRNTAAVASSQLSRSLLVLVLLPLLLPLPLPLPQQRWLGRWFILSCCRRRRPTRAPTSAPTALPTKCASTALPTNARQRHSRRRRRPRRHPRPAEAHTTGPSRQDDSPPPTAPTPATNSCPRRKGMKGISSKGRRKMMRCRKNKATPEAMEQPNDVVARPNLDLTRPNERSYVAYKNPHFH